jgi:hypothetical protein
MLLGPSDEIELCISFNSETGECFCKRKNRFDSDLQTFCWQQDSCFWQMYFISKKCKEAIGVPT